MGSKYPLFPYEGTLIPLYLCGEFRTLNRESHHRDTEERIGMPPRDPIIQGEIQP